MRLLFATAKHLVTALKFLNLDKLIKLQEGILAYKVKMASTG